MKASNESLCASPSPWNPCGVASEALLKHRASEKLKIYEAYRADAGDLPTSAFLLLLADMRMSINLSPIQSRCVVRNISNSKITVLGRHQLRPNQTVDLFSSIADLTEGSLIESMKAPNGDLYKHIFTRGTLELQALELTHQTIREGFETGHWNFETLLAGIEYLGGFYQFASSDNDFSPLVAFGTANSSYAAHAMIVTGAVTVDDVEITVSGASINDNGVRVGSDTEVIELATGTAANTYLETTKKWLGQISIETTVGTAVTCNYGLAKYHDFNNQDFKLVGLEGLWTAGASGSTNNIELIHHKAEGWTFNSGDVPDPPLPIASRSEDHGTLDEHVAGEAGAWKRSNLTTKIKGSDSEGVLWRITSEDAGVGNQSFRTLNMGLSVKILVPGAFEFE